jgi:ABC-type branched-subunit amino acid transport system substrate-binding protein
VWRRLKLFPLLLVVGVVAACGGSDDGSESGGGASSGGKASTVKVTAINDLSGPTASTQVPYNEGIKAGFEAYNKALADGQHQIEASFVDDKFDPAQALAAYKKATSDGSVLTIGPNSSAAQPALVKQGLTIPVISGVSTTITDDKMLWNLLPKFTDQAAVMANYAKTKLGGESFKAAALVYDVPSGIEFAKALKSEVEALGGEYLGDVVIAPAEAAGTWRSQAQKLAELKPDFVGFLGSAADPQTFLPAMNNAGLSNVIVGGVTPALLYKENWTKTPKNLAEKFFGTSSISPADVPTEGSAKVEAAAQAAGKPEYANNLYFVQGYVAAQLAAKAINDAGADPTPESVNEAMGKITDYTTGDLNPPLCFGPDDHYGTGASRPLSLDLATQKFVADGEFSDYTGFVKSTDGGC